MDNGYQASIISKIFKRITNNHSLPQPQQLTQATDGYLWLALVVVTEASCDS